MLKMFRCRREELVGGNLLDLVSPTSLAEAAACVQAEGEDPHELLLQRKDGSTFPVETQARMIRIGPRTLRLNALRDITVRRQLFVALEQQRLRLEGIVNSATDGIITIDGEQRIVVFNPAAERMFQCPAEGALGQPVVRFIPGLSPSRLAELTQPPVQEVAKPAAKGQFNVGPGRRASGEEFPLETTLAQLALGDQRLVTLSCRDLTDLLRTEAARQQLESQFRQAQKMDAVGTLAGGIAHDFNNILAAINAYAELAKLTAPENALLQEHLQLLLKSSDRATGLVRQLLSFSQQQRQDHRNLRLAPVLADALKRLQSNLPATIALVPNLDQEVPAIRADAARIQQVLTNLVENAADALKHKGGQIQVTLDLLQLPGGASRPHLALREDRYVRLTVRDDGPGMDRATLKRIFEPFFTTKEPGKGTGLGLAVAHGVIKNHGGVITAESEPGRGTTFTIYLPPARAEAVASPTAHVVI
jgi:PAS domain S-box-containing protein